MGLTQLVADIDKAYRDNPHFVPTRYRLFEEHEDGKVDCCAIGAVYKKPKFLSSSAAVFESISRLYEVPYLTVRGLVGGFDSGMVPERHPRGNFTDQEWKVLLDGYKAGVELHNRWILKQ